MKKPVDCCCFVVFLLFGAVVFWPEEEKKKKKFGCEILIYLLPLVKFLDMWAFIQFFIIII